MKRVMSALLSESASDFFNGVPVCFLTLPPGGRARPVIIDKVNIIKNFNTLFKIIKHLPIAVKPNRDLTHNLKP